MGSAKEASAVNATTMTIIGLTTPAVTAACPIIRPPTIPIVLPMGPGILTPASLKSSKANSINSTSTSAGNGTSINNNAEMIVQLMYKAVFERTGIDEVSTYFVADEAVRAKLTAVYDAMVLAIEPEDGSTLNSMDITEFSEHDIKLIYPSQVNLLLSFNCTFSARGARQEGGGIREKYDGTATSITTFHFIKDNENWLCDDFTMECIDYSKEEVEEETEEE